MLGCTIAQTYGYGSKPIPGEHRNSCFNGCSKKKCSIAICRMEKNSSSNGLPPASTSSFRSAVPPSVLPDPQTAPGSSQFWWKRLNMLRRLRLLLTNMLKIWSPESPGTETNPKAWWTKAKTWPSAGTPATSPIWFKTPTAMIGPWKKKVNIIAGGFQVWNAIHRNIKMYWCAKRWTKRWTKFEYIAHQFKS